MAVNLPLRRGVEDVGASVSRNIVNCTPPRVQRHQGLNHVRGGVAFTSGEPLHLREQLRVGHRLDQ